jgi:hypothetical protein
LTPNRRINAFISNIELLTALLILGVLSFGWVVYPALGNIWGLLNASVIAIGFAGLAGRAILIRFTRPHR